MRPRPYIPPPPSRAPVISMSAVYHALRHRGTAALSGGGYRVALLKLQRSA